MTYHPSPRYLAFNLALIALIFAQAAAQSADRILPAPKQNVLPVHLPSLTGLESGVRDQLLSLQNSIAARLREDRITDQQLSEAYGLLGRVYHAYALAPPAEECYRNAERLAPKDFRWPYLLGCLYQAEARAAEALVTFQRSQKLRPDYLATPVNLGNLHLQQNHLEDAQAAFKEALALDARCAAAHYGLGQVALSQRRYAEAITHFNQALATAPAANRINYSLAMAYRGLGETEKAQSYLERQGSVGVRVADPLREALQELVRGERLHLIRGRMAFDAGRFADAVAEFRQAVAANSASIPAHINLGSALSQLGETQAAIAEFQAALRLAPDNSAARYNLGVLFGGLKQFEPAIEHLRAALKARPEDAEARLLLARTLVKASRLEEASTEYTQVVAAQPEEEDALLEWAQLLTKLKQHSAALAELEKASQRFPTRGRTAAALAYLLAASPQMDLRNGARALDLAQRVYQATGAVNHGALVALALAELGRCQEAAAMQRRLLSTAESEKQIALAAKLKTDLEHYDNSASCRPTGGAGSTP